MAHASLIRNTFYCNMNHVMRIIEFFLHKEEDLTFSYILSMNLPFIFANLLDYQLVQQGFLNLFNCSETGYLNRSNQQKVYQYALRSKFFVDLAKMMLLGEDSVDQRKTSQTYLGLGTPVIIESGSHREIDYSTQSDSIFEHAHNVFPESNKNFQPDLDRIKAQYFATSDPNRKSLPLRVSGSKKNSMKSEGSKLAEVQREIDSPAKPTFMGYEFDKLPKGKIDKLSKYPSLKLRWEKFLKDVEIYQSADKRNDEEHKKGAKDPTRKQQRKVSSNQFRIKDSKRSTSPSRSLSRGPSMIVEEDNSNPPSPVKRSIQEIERGPKHSLLEIEERPKFGNQKSRIGSTVLGNSPGKNPKSAIKFEEAVGLNSMQNIGALYPIEAKNVVRTEADKESEGSEFMISKIHENDDYSLIIAEILHMMIRRMIENDQNAKMKSLLRKQTYNYSQLWQAMLGVDQSVLFEYLLKNYLYKIKAHPAKNLNSGYEAGETVNLLLEHAYSSLLTDTIGTARLQLVRTLTLILKNDKSRKYALLEQITDPCWHTLIIWIFNYRTNNMYLNLIHYLLEIVFEHGSERTAITILIKLDLIIKMRNAMSEICKNGVYLKELHIDNLIFFFRRTVKLIEKILERDYPTLKGQLNNSFSWSDLKLLLYPQPPVILSESRTNIKTSRETSLIGGLDDKSGIDSPLKPRLSTPAKLSSRFLTPQKESSARSSYLLPPIQTPSFPLSKKSTDSPIKIGNLLLQEKNRSRSTKNLRISTERANKAIGTVMQRVKTESSSINEKILTITPSFKTKKLI